MRERTTNRDISEPAADWFELCLRTLAVLKQLGAKPIAHVMPFGNVPLHRPEGGPLRDKKGGAMEEWPADLRVREMP